MADVLPPPQVIINAGVDSKTIEDTVNGAPDTQVTSRLGRKFWTLATINARVDLTVQQSNAAIAQINSQKDSVVQHAVVVENQIDVQKANVDQHAQATISNINTTSQDAISSINEAKNNTQGALDNAVQDFENQGGAVLTEFRDAVQTIVVDDGVPAQAVVVGDSTLDVFAKDVSRYTPLPYNTTKEYAVGERVTLATSEIVQNTVAGNTTNPNVNLTGWKKGTRASDVVDESGKNQQEINVGISTYLSIGQFPFIAGEADDTSRINRLIQKAADLGVRDVYITDGDYSINPAVTSSDWLGITTGGGVQLQSGVHVWLSKNARLVSKASSFNGYNVVAVITKKDCGIYGGKIIGDREIHIGTTGEHGMGVNVRGSEDVYIFTDIENCWGDGIYIGSAYAANGIPCKNVHVKSVCYNNRRQGMSVVDVDGLFVHKGTQFNKTNGTAPQSGFDLEPNANQTVQNVYMEHVVCRENTAVGALIYAEAANANVENVTIDYLETTDNAGFGLRVHGSGTNGVHIKKLVTARNADVAALMHNSVKNVTVDHHESVNDYRPIQASSSSGITIGHHVSEGATFSFPIFNNITNLVIKNIEPRNTNFTNAVQINNCHSAKVSGKTAGSNSSSVIIDSCTDGEFLFEVSGNKAGDYIQVKGASSGNTVTLKGGESLRTSNDSYGVHLTDTANNNVVVHCVMKSQANEFKSLAGVFCGVNTANNRVGFNDVSEGFYSNRSVIDASGNNVLEYNSGQFVPRTPSVVNNDMSNKASVYNTKNKFINRQVYNTTDGRLYFATGASDISSWRPVGATDASSDVTPT